MVLRLWLINLYFQNSLVNGIERLNVFDGDEFDIMTQDVMDTSRIHTGKR